MGISSGGLSLPLCSHRIYGSLSVSGIFVIIADRRRGPQRNDQLSPAHEFISRASLVSNRSSQAFAGDVWNDALRSERKREGLLEFRGRLPCVYRAGERKRRKRDREGKQKREEKKERGEKETRNERAAPYSQTRKFQKALDYVMSWRAWATGLSLSDDVCKYRSSMINCSCQATRYFARAYRNPFTTEVRIPHIIVLPTTVEAERAALRRVERDGRNFRVRLVGAVDDDDDATESCSSYALASLSFATTAAAANFNGIDALSPQNDTARAELSRFVMPTETQTIVSFSLLWRILEGMFERDTFWSGIRRYCVLLENSVFSVPTWTSFAHTHAHTRIKLCFNSRK